MVIEPESLKSYKSNMKAVRVSPSLVLSTARYLQRS